MKVKELIEALQQCDSGEDICFLMNDGCCGDFLDLEAYEVDVLDTGRNAPWPRIWFRAVPGYRSCIQSGGTKKADEEYWKQFGGKKDE